MLSKALHFSPQKAHLQAFSLISLTTRSFSQAHICKKSTTVLLNSSILINTTKKSYLLHPKIAKNYSSNSRTTVSLKSGGESNLKDVYLYKHENPSYIRRISLFTHAQFLLWSFMGFNMGAMKDTEIDESILASEQSYFWQKINLGSNRTKYVLMSLCTLIGACSLIFGYLYIARTVRYIILRKDAKNITLVTYTPFGKNLLIDVPIINLCCQGSRNDLARGHSYLPLRVKGKFLRYMVDLREEAKNFPNPKLFDQTAGLMRKF